MVTIKVPILSGMSRDEKALYVVRMFYTPDALLDYIKHAQAMPEHVLQQLCDAHCEWILRQECP